MGCLFRKRGAISGGVVTLSRQRKTYPTGRLAPRAIFRLQSLDFRVVHGPGSLHIIPDTHSPVFGCETPIAWRALASAPVGRDVPVIPRHVPRNLQPVMSDLNLNVCGDAIHSNATYAFRAIDPSKLTTERDSKFASRCWCRCRCES